MFVLHEGYTNHYIIFEIINSYINIKEYNRLKLNIRCYIINNVYDYI